MKEIFDLNMQVTGLLSIVAEHEKNHAAVKQLMFVTSSLSHTSTTPRVFATQDLSANQSMLALKPMSIDTTMRLLWSLHR